MRSLSAEDRAFFQLVSRAAFANPFGEERDRVDRTISGRGGTDEEILERVVVRVRSRLESLEVDGALRFGEFKPGDDELVQHTIVFDVFHRFFGGMDAHISAQRSAGKQPIRAAFAPSMLTMLTSRGFDLTRARKLVGLFFQMARAYFFIARGLLGTSRSMRSLRESLWNAAVTFDIGRYEAQLLGRMDDFSTILLGDTGTGKGAAAQALGQSGYIPYDESKERFTHAFTNLFLALNLSEFSENLVESELFGHAKGAFTGALVDFEGALARSGPHGVVFLDEIGEVSIPIQIKLLRVLQERSYRPVGSREERAFGGRVIAATHRSLDRLRDEGRFRDDFYYRLSSNLIRVPSLKERIAESPDELPLMTAHVVERIVGSAAPEVAGDVLLAIDRDLGLDYAWPGNVRELEQNVRRVLLTGRCGNASAERSTDPATSWLTEVAARTIDAERLLALYCDALYTQHGAYEKVASITGLDRRTVKRHVLAARRTA